MKPDTSFVLKSGHFHLLSTLTVRRSLARNLELGSNQCIGDLAQMSRITGNADRHCSTLEIERPDPTVHRRSEPSRRQKVLHSRYSPALSGLTLSAFRVCERAMQTATEEHIIVTRKLAGRRYDKVFFGCMVVLLLLIVFVGFARSYYLAGVFRAPLPAPILHIHAALNTSWMLLLAVQAFLVSAKKIRWHMTLGIAGFSLAVVMVGVGFVVSANQLRRYAHDPSRSQLRDDPVSRTGQLCGAGWGSVRSAQKGCCS